MVLHELVQKDSIPTRVNVLRRWGGKEVICEARGLGLESRRAQFFKHQQVWVATTGLKEGCQPGLNPVSVLVAHWFLEEEIIVN